MRRTLAVVLSAGLLLVWSFCQDLSLKAQIGPAVVTENGDVNGDGMRDIADAVSLLTYLFNGGPAPVACAQPMDLEARVSALEEAHASREFGLLIAGTYFAELNARKGVLTFTADGGFVWSSQYQFNPGAAGGSPDLFRSIMQGTWRKTGEDQITTDAYWLAFEANGQLRTTMATHRSVWTLTDGFNELSGQIVDWASWGSDLDPLQDSPDFCPRFFWTMTARRMDLGTPPRRCPN